MNETPAQIASGLSIGQRDTLLHIASMCDHSADDDVNIDKLPFVRKFIEQGLITERSPGQSAYAVVTELGQAVLAQLKNTPPPEPEIDDDFLMGHLGTITIMLALIPLKRLEAYVNRHSSSIQYWDSLGGMLDPTAYRDMLQGGQRDDAVNQLNIVKALLGVREAIEKRETFAKEVQAKHANRNNLRGS